MFESHIMTVPDWLCVTAVTVLLGDIVLLAFKKTLVLFSGHRKTAFLPLHTFMFNRTNFFYNCTVCAQLHTKKPWSAVSSPSGIWGRAPAEIEFGAF